MRNSERVGEGMGMLDEGRLGDVVLAIPEAARDHPEWVACAAERCHGGGGGRGGRRRGRRRDGGPEGRGPGRGAFGWQTGSISPGAAAGGGEGTPAETGGVSYCLADMAAMHFEGVGGMIPRRSYRRFRDEILHFASREEAEAVVRWSREVEDGHLRVMVVRPGERPVPLSDEESPMTPEQFGGESEMRSCGPR